MIDTHTHLYEDSFAIEGQAEGSMAGQRQAVERAIAAGVSTLIFPNIDRASIQPMKRLHELCKPSTYMAMGLHPTEVKENWRAELDFIMEELKANHREYVAVGEVGIDLYWDKTFEKEQMLVFEEQVKAARQLGMPVLIHCRDGLDQALEVLQPYDDVKLDFHSFGGTVEDVERIRRDHDAMFGINGIVTFKNSGLVKTLPARGLDRILTETDSPYLAPVPHRGKRNESAYIPLIVEKIAETFGMTAAEVDRITSNNALQFLNIQ